MGFQIVFSGRLRVGDSTKVYFRPIIPPKKYCQWGKSADLSLRNRIPVFSALKKIIKTQRAATLFQDFFLCTYKNDAVYRQG
jgi:hypothetical protein